MFYVLGDSSYSECCIDDVNASHAKANDMIIKFGKHCLSTCSRSVQRGEKEIVYVLTNSSNINFDELSQGLAELNEYDIYLYADSEYYLGV